MRAKPLAMTLGLLWGGAMLAAGLAHLFNPSYGMEFLRVMSSVYPGFHGSPTLGSVLVGTIYGLVDGAICGYLLGWLYCVFEVRRHPVRPAMDRAA